MFDPHSNTDEGPRRKSKEDKSDEVQRRLTATDSELKAIGNRNQNWRDNSGDRPGHNIERAKYTSNKTHYSPTDSSCWVVSSRRATTR